MTDYFIGDIQGCFDGLQKALASVEFNSGRDTLWLTGDIVARGDNSLETMQFIEKHASSIRFVLGNHDLHFMAVAKGIKKANKSDKLDVLLENSRCQYYVDFLRQYPLLLELPQSAGYMSHAGLPPDWQAQDAVTRTEQFSELLQSNGYESFLSNMYQNTPTQFSDSQNLHEQMVYTVNAMTRMRYCLPDGQLEFSEKRSPVEYQTIRCSDPSATTSLTPLLKPWFEFSPERFIKNAWVFGHWASLMGKTTGETSGEMNNRQLYALDTGYVWGNYLTILNWQTKESLLITA
jgi:bis(5'-nucleosyl)-tetraphosphatase (symmetrical)